MDKHYDKDKPALTIKDIAEQYNISRFVLMKWQKENKIKLHRPNCRDYIVLRADLENAIRAS